MEVDLSNTVSDNKKEQLNALLTERWEVRNTITTVQKGVFNALFAFITVLLGIGSVLWNVIDIPDKQTQGYIFIFLSQVQVFIGLLAVSQFTIQTTMSGYVQALEKKINSLLGERIIVFESEVGPRFITHILGTHVWSMILLVLMIAGFLVFLMLASFQFIQSFWFVALILFECAFVLILIFYALRDVDKVENYISSIIDSNITSPDLPGPPGSSE